MGILKIVKYAVKWSATTLIVCWLTYSNYSSISRAINNSKFYFSESESGFVPKDHAFDLRFNHERNGKGNLETYLGSYNSRLPIYMRSEGIMIGNADYNFSNFTVEEKSRLCSYKKAEDLNESDDSKPENLGTKKRIFKTLIELVGE